MSSILAAAVCLALGCQEPTAPNPPTPLVRELEETTIEMLGGSRGILSYIDRRIVAGYDWDRGVYRFVVGLSLVPEEFAPIASRSRHRGSPEKPSYYRVEVPAWEFRVLVDELRELGKKGRPETPPALDGRRPHWDQMYLRARDVDWAQHVDWGCVQTAPDPKIFQPDYRAMGDRVWDFVQAREKLPATKADLEDILRLHDPDLVRSLRLVRARLDELGIRDQLDLDALAFKKPQRICHYEFEIPSIDPTAEHGEGPGVYRATVARRHGELRLYDRWSRSD